jgi:DNA polymerase III gamma/tau subunit
MATIEQGMKVFTAIYKRIYRSLSKEYKKVFDLNNYYLDKDTYLAILGEQSLNPEDFDQEVYDVCPTADPTATTQTEKLMKAQALMELMQAFGPALDGQKVLMRILQAQEQPNWQELIPGLQQTGKPAPVQQPPDPKLLAIQAKAQADQQKAQLDQEAQQQSMQMDAQKQSADLQFKSQEHQMTMQQKQQEMRQEAQIHSQKTAMEVAGMQQNLAHTEQQHQMGMQQQQETHKAGLEQTKEAAKTKNEVMKSTSQKKTGTSGKTTK